MFVRFSVAVIVSFLVFYSGFVIFGLYCLAVGFAGISSHPNLLVQCLIDFPLTGSLCVFFLLAFAGVFAALFIVPSRFRSAKWKASFLFVAGWFLVHNAAISLLVLPPAYRLEDFGLCLLFFAVETAGGGSAVLFHRRISRRKSVS